MNMEVYRNLISKSSQQDRQRQPTEYEIEQQLQLQIQKKWIWMHSIILLFVSIITIPLLHSKAAVLSQFYDHNQCCYCLWVSKNSSVSQDLEIEWSVCKNKHKYSLNIHETCRIDEQDTCQTDLLTDIKYNALSYRSTFFFYEFGKYYPYYGIYTVVLVILYLSLLLITTYGVKTLIFKQLFICNLALTITIYYCYIKLYQYSMYNYHTYCPNRPSNVKPICYRSAFSEGLDFMFSLLVYATTIYTAYCIYIVCPCCLYCLTRYLSKYDICNKFGNWLAVIVLYIAVIGGSVFVIISYIVLMWMAVGVDNNFSKGLIKNVSGNWEEVFIIIIANVLLLLAFDMFFLKSCKQDLIEMFCKANKQQNENQENALNGNPHIPIQD
eukprot:154991_1